MAFFDDLGKKISDAGQSTIQKTKDLADTAKYTSQISDEEKNIKTNYALIGELYYEEIKDQPGDAYAQYVEKITESKNKINEYKNKIEEMKGRGKCPNCGASVALDDVFCASCGQKMEKSEGQTENCESACPKCGNKLTPGAAFCIHCGNKIEVMETVKEN